MSYNRKTNNIVGVEDHGNGTRSFKEATSVLVFMVQGVGGEFLEATIIILSGT